MKKPFLLGLLMISSFLIAQKSSLKIIETKKAENEKKESDHIQIPPKMDTLKIKEGPYEEYYKDKLITQGQVNKYGRQGFWTYYSSTDTTLSFEGSFLNNREIGKWIYHINKQIVGEIYFQKGSIDSAYSYYKNGELMYEYKALSDSMAFAKSYYKNGQLHQVIPVFKHEIHGITQIFFRNGQLHRKTVYKNSKIYKVINCFDQKGQEIYGGELSKGNGEMIFYHLPEDLREDTLIIMSSSRYKKGLLHGEAFYISKNGKAKERGSYVNDVKAGIWEEFDENGNFLRKRDYQLSGRSLDKQSNGSSFPWFVDHSIMAFSDPIYPDGEENMYRFIAKHIEYPKDAMNNGIQGRVYVSFTVNRQGNIEDVHILRGIGGGCDEECIRITQAMPRWQPGRLFGIPVRVQYSMPIKFTLE